MSKRTRRTKKVKNTNFFGARYLIPLAAGLAGIGIVAAVVATNIGDSSDIYAPTATPVTQESQLEDMMQEETIDYDMAKQDKNLREAYLNQLFVNRSQYGDEAWNSFAGIVYDPDFKMYDSEFERRGIKPKILEGYGDREDAFALAHVYFDKVGIPQRVYISKHAFEMTNLEDDLLAILDNESINAQLLHKERSHLSLNIPRDREMSSYMFALISEVLSFEKEFYNIETGKRNVSPEFLNGVLGPAKSLYEQLEQVASMNNGDSGFARGVLEAVSSRPTLKYFK